MTRTTFTLLAALLGLAMAPLAANATDSGHHSGIKIWKPYVIEKNCEDGRYKCQIRMDYAPFQNSMVARPGSYWYQKPFLHYSYGDFGSQDEYQPRQLVNHDRSSPNY